MAELSAPRCALSAAASLAALLCVMAGGAHAADTRTMLSMTQPSFMYGALIDGSTSVQYQGVPCGFFTGSAPFPVVSGSVASLLDGTPWRSDRLFYFSSADYCLDSQYMARGLQEFMDSNPLRFGRHMITAAFEGDANFAPSRSEPVAIEVVPQFEGAYAPGAVALRAGFTYPFLGGENWDCQLRDKAAIAASAAPSFPPEGFDFSVGLFSFGMNCTFTTSWLLQRPLQQEMLLQADRPLPAGATIWAYGPTPQLSAPHWYTVSGHTIGPFAQFMIYDGGQGDASALDGKLQGLVGIGIPKATLASDVQGMWWGGSSENGWGMAIIQHGTTLFATLFIYDANGHPQWAVLPGGSWNASFTSFSGNLYVPSGSWLGNYDVSKFSAGSPAGTATLSFSSRDAATLTYSLQGKSGAKAITRQQFGVPDSPALDDYSALWWGGDQQNGWGISIIQQSRTLFAVWYTYDRDGKTVWYTMPGGSWKSPATYGGSLYRTSGSPWAGAPYDAAALSVTPAGTISIAFDKPGEAGTVTYSVDGVSGTNAIVRQPF